MIKFGLPLQLHVDHSDRKRNQKKMLTPELFEPVKNSEYGWCKPTEGGLWTSTLTEEVWSDWCRWTHGEQFMYKDGEDAFILTVSPTAKIFEINGQRDVKWLKDRYSMIDPPGSPALKFDHLRLDWEKIAKDFDGVHLTEDGNYQLHLTDLAYCMNAWDAESTIWLHWAFTNCVPTNIINPEDNPKKRKVTVDA